MKTTSLILAPILGLAVLLSPTRAEEATPPAVSPDVQALLGELSKLAAGSKSKDEQLPDVQALFGLALKMMSGAAAKDGQAPDLQALLGDLIKSAPGAASKDGQVKNPQEQELQTQLLELVKAISKMVPEEAPVPDPAPASAATGPGAKTAQPTAGSPKTGPLGTGSLTGGSLAPSSSLNGRGTTGGTPRLSESDWRLLFPARDDRK